MMITGDHPRTAARIALELGITGADARAVTGVETDELDQDAFRQTVREASVHATDPALRG